MRISRRQLEEKVKKQAEEIATLNVLLRAYIQSNQRLQDDIEALNQSLNCTAAELKRWQDIARKADERRLEYVRGMVSTD